MLHGNAVGTEERKSHYSQQAYDDTLEQKGSKTVQKQALQEKKKKDRERELQLRYSE